MHVRCPWKSSLPSPKSAAGNNWAQQMRSSYSAAADALLMDNRDNGACIPAVGSCFSVGFGPDKQFSGL